MTAGGDRVRRNRQRLSLEARLRGNNLGTIAPKHKGPRIEGVRSTTTDEQGQFRIIELRPGTYTVTFSLPGFGVFKREGLELTSNFTATVNAELRIGELKETVTVTGQSPLVDVQNVTPQKTISRRRCWTLSRPARASWGSFR